MEILAVFSLVFAAISFGLLLKNLKSKKMKSVAEKYRKITGIFLLIFLTTSVLAVPEIKAKEARLLRELKAEEIQSKVEIKEVKVTEEISYETQTKDEGRLLRGQVKVQQEGKNGKKEKKYKVIFVDGKEERRILLTEETVLQPVNKIVLKGTLVALPVKKKIKNYYRSRNNL